MRRHAKASPARSTEGSDKGRGLLRRCLPGLGSSSEVNGGDALRGRRRLTLFLFCALLAILVLTAVGLASAAPPAVVMGTAANASYTSAEVTGEVNPEGEVIEWAFQVSSDGGASWEPTNVNGVLDGSVAGLQPVGGTLALKPATTYRVRLMAHDFSDGVEVLSPEPSPEFTTEALPNPTVSIDLPTAATATTVQLSGSIDPEAPAGNPSASDVNWHFECQPACPGVEGSIPADSSSHVVTGEATGLKFHTEYEVTLVAVNANGPTSSPAEHFTTGAVKPTVRTLPGFALRGGMKALVGGLVNPQNSETRYWVEYGLDESYGTSSPASEDAVAGSGEEPILASQVLTGLQPSTTYHYRLLAANSAGTVEGDDETVTTASLSAESSIGPGQLPDGRVLEMVSPPEKNNSDIFRGYAWASASGDALAFKSQGSFAGQPTSRAGLVSDYISRRQDGSAWTTAGITPPNGNFLLSAGQYGFTEDLATGFLVQNVKSGDPGLDPEHPADPTPVQGSHVNWYLRDNLSGRYRLVSPVLPGNNVGAIFRGGSADYSHLALGSQRHLTADSPCSESVEPESADPSLPVCAYEYANGSLRLASVLPGEVPANGEADAISKDGSKLYFTSGEHLYVRLDGTSTTQIDVSERTSPATVPAAPVTFLRTDSRSEGKVLFMTEEDLVDADENSGPDLYLYDPAKPAGSRLTLVSKGDLAGDSAQSLRMLLASEDLNRVYFSATNQLLSGQPANPGNNIYLWEDDGGQGALEPVATVSNEDLLTNASNASNQPISISVSPDGAYLAFVSKALLTAYDNAGKDEVYRYSAADGQLACVSCEPEGAPPTTSATLEDFGEGNPTEHHLRNVTDRGLVFFQSVEPLALRDSNGQRDVYEYENGLPRLISTGVGGAESWFVDASVSGDDVFFATRDRLVGWDTDNNYDIYDARVNGGLPEPPPAVVGCDGDACQPAPSPPNDPTPASANFNGAGNVTQRVSHHRHKHHAKKRRKHQKGAGKRESASATRKRG